MKGYLGFLLILLNVSVSAEYVYESSLFSLTPDNPSSTYASAELLEDATSGSIVDNEWHCVGTRYSDGKYCVHLNLLTPGDAIHSVKLTIYGYRITSGVASTQFTTFSMNNDYFTMANDWDSNDPLGGVMIAPQCNSGAIYSTDDIFTLLDTTDTFDSFMDDISGGDESNFEYITSMYNGDTSPIMIEMTNDIINNQVIVSFESATVDKVTCNYDTSFGSYTDMSIFFTPYFGPSTLTITQIDGEVTWMTTTSSDTLTCGEKCTDLSATLACGNDQCVENCKNCVSGIGWNDYDNGQSTSCVCHINGCDQCDNGFFKVNYDFPCQSCDELVGCLHCSDFLGCQQCEEGYTRVVDSTCGDDTAFTSNSEDVHYCELDDDNTPGTLPTDMPTITAGEGTGCPVSDENTCDSSPCDCTLEEHCSNCQNWGCQECEDGYYKQSFGHKCVSCSETFDGVCMTCTDWSGCTQCVSGYTVTWDTDCGTNVCEQTDCVEYISVTSMDVAVTWYRDGVLVDLSQYLGDYYYSGLESDHSSTAYPVYRLASGKAEITVFPFKIQSVSYFIHLYHSEDLEQYDYSWFLINPYTDPPLLIDDSYVQIYSVNPFEGIESEWITNSYPGSIDVVANLVDNCYHVGFDH